MFKYFEVIAKCGHVGRDKYFEGKFYIRAENGKEAALIARKYPRVKHDHKDAILKVNIISEEEYFEGIENNRNNPYHKCESKWQQKQILDEIQDFIKDETDYHLDRLIDSNIKKEKTKIKKPYKRKHINKFDYEEE